MKIQSAKAGIGTGRAGLQAASGLFSNAGLFDKGVKSFNPLDLDPYLLFDAQTSMIGTLENPTLDLDPSKQDTLDVITATRAGVATYTDFNGNIATAPANTVRVDQTQGAELTPTKFQRIGYTDFSQGWAAQSGVVAQGADDYQGNAVRRLTFDGVTTGGIYQTTINTIGGVSYTGSFYIRRISGSTPLYMRHGFSASGNQTAISVTTEWQQFSVTMLGASGGGNVYFGILQFGAGNDVYEITQPQFEEGTTASDFVENTTGSPKFITGATFGPRVPMILVEPSATNLVTYSEDFSHSSWNTGSASVTVDYGYLSPSGDLTASKITKQTTNGHLYSGQATGAKSIFIKGTAGETVATLDRFTDANTLITLTGEWQRVELNGVNVNFYAVDFRAGTATEVYIWGAQLETGSVSTSYIPTSGGDAAARTRAKDDLVISGSDFDFYNQSEGTFYAESNTRRADGVPFIVEVENGGSNRIYLYHGTTTARAHVKTGGTTQADFSLGSRPAVGVLSRAALSYKTNDIEGSLDGGSVIGDTSATIPTTINRFNLGTRFGQSDTYKLNGHIKRLIYWPYHSDNL